MGTSITRREAIKKMGAVAVGAAISASGLSAAENIVPGEKKRLKVLAINGSTRRDGNTADMINIVLEEIRRAGYERELIQLSGEDIAPCKACFACAGKGNCVFGDDRFQELYHKMTEADGILLGSPTYSADVSATLKAVMERASIVCDNNRGMLRHKVCGTIAVARRAGAMNVLDTLNHFFLNKEAFLVGSTYWNVAYGRLPGEALHDEEGVETMKHLGQHMAWLLEKITE